MRGLAMMEDQSAIDPALLGKYQETEYRVRAGEESFVLELARPSEALARLYRGRKASSAAFMSACNPYSQATSRDENEQANARLRAQLLDRGFDVVDALGSDGSEGGWAEPSVLVLGISREEAERFGRDYRQNAIVFAAADAVPELVLLR